VSDQAKSDRFINGASTEALGAVRYLRSRATELRKQADLLNREADLLEQRLAPGLLKGGQIVDTAVEVLEADEVRGPWHRGVHYKDLLPMVERDGRRVRGIDPAATLLTNLHRDPRVELAEPVSGRFRLAATEGAIA
jgi:hypothetical protein